MYNINNTEHKYRPVFFERKDYEIVVYTRTSLPYGPHHFHKHIEVFYVTEGEGQIYVEGTKYTVHKDEAVIVFPNQIHGYEKGNNTNHIIVLISPDMIYDNIDFINKIPKCALITGLDKNPRIFNYISSISQIYNENKPNREIIARGLMSAFFSEIFEETEFIASPTNISLSQALLNYCINNYQKDITLEKLSKELYISKNYISQIFNQKLMISMPDYINYLRVNYAKQLLRETDETISNISTQCGFKSIRTFNHTFFKVTNKTPSEYRKISYNKKLQTYKFSKI